MMVQPIEPGPLDPDDILRRLPPEERNTTLTPSNTERACACSTVQSHAGRRLSRQPRPGKRSRNDLAFRSTFASPEIPDDEAPRWWDSR